jgi:WhiB family redox-sensing transcriptional regulator
MTDLRHLPGPRPDLWEWQLDAACRELDTEMFFHPENERGPRRAAREAAAKAVCARCPVMAECAAHALRAREPYGIWGGLSESERDDVLAGRRTAAAS